MQGTLERTIKEVTGETVNLTASGRTDAGAHASDQVVSFTTTSPLPAGAFLKALNAGLPRDIAIASLSDVDLSFHPRFDARSRTYRYLIWNRPVRSPFWNDRAAHVKQPLNTVQMNRAAEVLIGRHDMTSFIPVAYDGDPERAVFRTAVERNGDLISIEIEASGFMRQMVRAIVGTLIRVGLGSLSVEDFQNILSSRRRALAGDTVPAEGLYLVSVRYEPDPSDAIPESAIQSAAVLSSASIEEPA